MKTNDVVTPVVATTAADGSAGPPRKISKAARPPQFGHARYADCPPNLTIWTWNINGLNANAEKNTLRKFIEEADPDILCLNETKTDLNRITTKKFNLIIPEGYEQHWNCCNTKRGYSGVALLSKVKPIQVMYGIQIPKHDTEGRVLTAEYEKFYLVAVYVPNSGDQLKRIEYRINEWDRDFTRYLKALEKKKPVILAGDLNVTH
jgi:AP endonuclease-1